MDENILQRNIRRESDRFIEEREPEHRVHLPKIEIFHKDEEAYKFEPFNKILKAPTRDVRILRVKPVGQTAHQQVFKHDIIRSKIPKLVPYDVAHPKNKGRLLN